MTDNDELLPCPICSKKVYIGLYGDGRDYWWMVHGGMHYDECKCRLFMESCKFELEDEAKVDYDERAMGIRGGLVRRWNTRTELGSWTCENVAREWEKASFAHACTSFCCSECGAHYVDAECYYAGLAGKDEEQIRTNFCPNCGRRVIA